MGTTAEAQLAETQKQHEGQADKGQVKVTETPASVLGHYHLPPAKDAAHLAIRSLQGVEGNILAGLTALEDYAQDLSDCHDACDIQAESEREAGAQALETAQCELEQVRREVAEWFGHVESSQNVMQFPDAELRKLEALSLRLAPRIGIAPGLRTLIRAALLHLAHARPEVGRQIVVAIQKEQTAASREAYYTALGGNGQAAEPGPFSVADVVNALDAENVTHKVTGGAWEALAAIANLGCGSLERAARLLRLAAKIADLAGQAAITPQTLSIAWEAAMLGGGSDLATMSRIAENVLGTKLRTLARRIGRGLAPKASKAARRGK